MTPLDFTPTPADEPLSEPPQVLAGDSPAPEVLGEPFGPSRRALSRLLLLRPLPGFALKYLWLYHEAVERALDEQYARMDAREWAEGENRATLFFRSLFALVAGSYLVWAQNRTNIQPGFEWNRWISLSVVANFVLPLLIANLFLAQGLRSEYFHQFLPDPKLTAWRLGWRWAPLKRFATMSLAMFIVMLPILWITSQNTDTQSFYRAYFPPVSSPSTWAWLVGTLIIYMACWEWFFRGFLLFSLAQGFGAPLAIVLQAGMFGLAHWDKPPLEMASSFVGGLILGIVAWREKSFVPAFLTHALIHVAWAILMLR